MYADSCIAIIVWAHQWKVARLLFDTSQIINYAIITECVITD
jgi:hypothetical protein